MAPRKMATAAPLTKQVNFSHWMERAAGELERILPELAPDPVHDLRVALRRCRSIASSFRMIDLHPGWRRMDRAARSVFRQLGELRDVQVLAEWARRLGDAGDPVTTALLGYCSRREMELRSGATVAITRFDRRRWASWSALLSERCKRVPVDGSVFRALALHRYTAAHALHHEALRNRTKVAYHDLRIGLKKFRYVVENFLPERHREWGRHLKELQDLLGDVHDLDVLWATALRQKMFASSEVRERWRSRIEAERATRLERYRHLMLGPDSLWKRWRRGLPQGAEMRSAEHARLTTWAAFLDPDVSHSQRVARWAAQIHAHLAKTRPRAGAKTMSEFLRAAALMHGVGGSPKRSRRLIRKLVPPAGWKPGELNVVAMAVRFYRGPLPSTDNKSFAALGKEQQEEVRVLAAVLRLADALDRDHSGSVKRISVRKSGDSLLIEATGLKEDGPNGQAVAAGRYLLERLYGMPVIVRGSSRLYRMVSSRTSTR